MRAIPRDERRDATAAILRDPYRYISKTSRSLNSDVFQLRFLLRRTLFLTGGEAAELFYDRTRFVRGGAAPQRFLKTLFGQGGVQGLDGESHEHCKRMFMSLMESDRIAELARLCEHHWLSSARAWTRDGGKITLYPQAQELLCRSVCAWAGVPLAEGEVGPRTSQLTAMFDAAGTVGPRHWHARLARRQAERWIAEIVENIQARRTEPPAGSAAAVIAWHRDPDGELLSPRLAAVELLNVLRPTVAVAVFIVFAALALHDVPECRERIANGAAGFDDLFVQEVRRFYPFFPAVVARVKDDFQWRDYSFSRGTRVLLDLYGTNHDPRIWNDPETFRPERFRDWNGSPFEFIPQGGGDHHENHRCPGEWIVIALLKTAIHVLARTLEYDVPEQNLAIDFARLPALPRSRFVMDNVRLTG